MSNFSAPTAMTTIAPLVAPLPDHTPTQYFTPEQWKTLLAIMDAAIPSLRRESAAQKSDVSTQSVLDVQYDAAVHHAREHVKDLPADDVLDEYLTEKPSDCPGFEELLSRTLMDYSRGDARKAMSFVLSSLDTRVGCLLLTGTTTSFRDLPVTQRQAIVASWGTSRIAALQFAYKQLTMVAKNLWFKTSPTWPKVSGFPKVPDHYDPPAHFEYEFKQFPEGSEPAIVETDVVIVGSGCGGGVSAKNLAEAGHKVLVTEKGYSFKTNELPMTERDAGIHLYVDGGIVSSDDGSINVIAGSSWGGGGTINWSASLQPQSFVRKEWAQDRGMPFFGTTEFQDCLDRVCGQMGVSTEHIRHNHGNQVLLEGARKMGMTVKPVPQNTGGNEHFCGHCTLGCGSGQKQGPVVSWLPAAAKAGAEFIEGYTVKNVIFENINGVKTAVGVKGTWLSRNSSGGVDGPKNFKIERELIVRAKKVIISGGTLWSPVILANSGLTNKHIGRHLYLHPVNIVSAVFPEDIRPWEGGILTSVVGSLENQDGHGHGTKLETTTMMPSWCLTFMNWNNGLDYKMQALKYRHMNSYIAITRDRDPGRVYRDTETGFPRIEYTPSKFDAAHTMEGVLAIARINYTMGASELHVSISNTPSFICGADRSPAMDAKLEAWLADVKKRGNPSPLTAFASAHQMGTCRMAKNASMGVVSGQAGSQGKVFGTEGLYVADASVFPSASGVNPMVTNMAISDWISRGVAKTLTQEKNGLMTTAKLGSPSTSDSGTTVPESRFGLAMVSMGGVAVAAAVAALWSRRI